MGQNPTEIQRPAEVPGDYTFNFLSNIFLDFDGDGSKDIVIKYHKLEGTPLGYFHFYSYSKKQTIAIIPLQTYNTFKFEDIDHDGTTEFIVQEYSKLFVYEITSAIGIKKKHQ